MTKYAILNEDNKVINIIDKLPFIYGNIFFVCIPTKLVRKTLKDYKNGNPIYYKDGLLYTTYIDKPNLYTKLIRKIIKWR